MTVPFHQYFALLARYLWPQWGRVSVLALLLFGGIGLQLFSPQLIRQFIDTAQAGLVADLLPISLLYLAVALLNQIIRTGATYVTEEVRWRATNWLRNDLSRHCLRLDQAFHHENTPGTMIERLDGDVTALSNFFSQFVLQIIGSTLLLIGVLVLLYREDWRIGLTFTLLEIIMLYVWRKKVSFGVERWEARLAANANLTGQLEEWLGGIEDIRANGAVDYILQQFQRAHYKVYQAVRGTFVVGLSWAFSAMIFDISLALALGVGAYLWQTGALTIGALFLCWQYGKLLQNPLAELAHQAQDLQAATASIVRIRELFDRQPTIQTVANPVALPPTALPVAFEGVEFRYNAEPPVLQQVSFQMAAGKVMGLLGRTGSGKTTITRLLFRLYDPTSGVITLGGRDLRTVDVDELRRHIGLVTQEVQLFAASVRDNLTFFDHTIADEEIHKAIDLLGLTGWFAGLEQGLDTLVGSGGRGLSAGEAQLLAFTRVFLKNPSLVILDEASSRLDPVTEQLLERAIDRLLANRTAIIIAHRLTTVQRVDTICILRDGQVLEKGDRVALMADPNSHFNHLLRVGMTVDMTGVLA